MHGQSAVLRLGLLRTRGVAYPKHTPEEMGDVFLDYGSDVLYANRCHLVLKAVEMQRRWVGSDGLKLLARTGEVIGDGHRAIFPQEFGAELVESDGSVEMGIMVCDTPDRNGLRMCEDLTYLEFVDEKERPAAPGARGRVVVTDLAGELMPFIRYDQVNSATYREAEAVGGSKSRRLTQIWGRDCDFIQLKDASLRPNIDVTNPPKRHDRLVQYQVIQHMLSRIDILVAAGSDDLDAHRDEILDELGSVFPADVSFEVIQVERIVPDSSGKVQSVVSAVGAQGTSLSPYRGSLSQ